MKYIYLISLLSLLACADFLDRHPLGEPSDGTFLQNESEMELAIVGCYHRMKLSHEGDKGLPFFIALDYLSDIGFDRNTNQLTPIAQGAHDPTNGMIRDYWATFYMGIASCNYLINNMKRGKNNVKVETYNRINAEAKFLRALYYLYLTELWGDVPFTLNVLGLSNSKMPKTDKAVIVDYLIQELNDIAQYLPKSMNPNSGRATRGACYGLISRMALYNARWQNCVDAALKVMEMEGSEYILSDNYQNLFNYAGENNKEIILCKPSSKDAEMLNAYYRFFGSRLAGAFTNKKPSIQLADSYECIDGLAIDKSPLFDVNNPYLNRDPRLQASLAVPGSIFLGFQFETHGDSVECWNYRSAIPKRVYNEDALNPYASFTGVCFKKYTDIADAYKNDGEINAIFMRYAEILLNYAEAKTELNQIDITVLTSINKVRTRKSVEMPPITTTDKTLLLQAIRRERKYEFAGEGLRLFDIRRWKLAEEVMNMPVLGRMKRKNYDFAPRLDVNATPHYDNFPIAGAGELADFKMRVVQRRSFRADRDYLWPIPNIDIQTNRPLLIQNPNY